MNVSSVTSIASTSQTKSLSAPVREPEGVKITSDSCMFANLDQVQLSQRGIALAEQRKATIAHQKPIAGEGIVDNTDDFNRFMRAYGEKNGVRFITYGSEDLTNGFISVSKNKRLINYYDMESMSDYKISSHDFFVNSTDFLIDAAKEYAKIDVTQDLLYRPTQDRDFINSTLDWLYGDQVNQQDFDNMRSQVDKIVRELAEQLKSGADADLSKLQSKFSFRGDEISAVSLINAQKLTSDFVDVLNPGATGGNEGCAYENWARRGMLDSLSNYYYGSLGDVGKQFKSAMERTISSDIETSKKIDYECSIDISKEYAMNVRDRHDEAYKRFSSLDQTNMNSLNQSFSEQLDWFGKSINELFHYNDDQQNMKRLQNVYNTVMQHMPAHL